MVVRLVKLHFREDAVDSFLELFENKRDLIRGFAGCRHLELWRDHLHPQVFFTYSIWENTDALNNYRQSGFFQETWQATKALFGGKPEAWTVDPVTVSA
jgi:quinol monooxygenase YgiN